MLSAQYAAALAIVLVTEIVVFLILFGNLKLFQEYAKEAFLGAGLGMLAEVITCLLSVACFSLATVCSVFFLLC